VATPRIAQRGRANQVDPRLPAGKEAQVGVETIECFT